MYIDVNIHWVYTLCYIFWRPPIYIGWRIYIGVHWVVCWFLLPNVYTVYTLGHMIYTLGHIIYIVQHQYTLRTLYCIGYIHCTELNPIYIEYIHCVAFTIRYTLDNIGYIHCTALGIYIVLHWPQYTLYIYIVLHLKSDIH